MSTTAHQSSMSTTDVPSPIPDYRGNARFAGAMFVVAIVSSLVGGTMIQGVLDQPEFMTGLLTDRPTVIVGVWLEIVNALAVLGIVAALWTPLCRVSPSTTVGYLGVRLIEAMVCIAAAFIPIILLMSAEQGGHEGVGLLNLARVGLVENAVPVVFGASAVLLYAMLFRSGLVPRYITVWGLIGGAGIIANLVIGDPTLRPLLVLPMIANEVYLGIYLLVRGLRSDRLRV